MDVNIAAVIHFQKRKVQMPAKEEIKKGDFVFVTGKGTEAFRVEWINRGSVGLHNGSIKPLNKVDKIDPNKFEITPYTTYYWREKD